jgi:6-phosphofructokinase
MGMHAGWLALSSSMGHPDFIIIPEFPLDYNSFVEKVKNKFLEQKHLIIVIAEGARWANGYYIAADENEKDSFGHPRFKGSAALLTEKLKNDLKPYFDTRNVNSVNPSYLYRSGKPNDLDFRAATMLGEKAVELINEKIDSPLFLTTNFIDDELCVVSFPLNDTDDIESLHRFVTEEFYDTARLNITEAGKNFVSKVVREFPIIEYKLF